MKHVPKFALLSAAGVFFAAMVALLSVHPAGAAKTPLVPSTEHRTSEHRLDNTGGPDGYGYRFVDNQGGDTASFNWVELRGSSQTRWVRFQNPDDDVSEQIVWSSFRFPFYGRVFSRVRITTNGVLILGGSAGNPAFANDCLPSRVISDTMICAFWDDLHLFTGGRRLGDTTIVGYREFADRFVVLFDSVGDEDPQHRASYRFEIVLWYNGHIELLYDNLVFDQTAQGQTIGIQAGSNGPALQYVCNATGPQPVTDLAIRFYHGDAGMIRGTVRDLSGAALSGADVEIHELALFSRTAATGEYFFPLVPSGTYTLIASRSGFQEDTAYGVVVSNQQTTIRNFVLVPSDVRGYAAADVPMQIPDLDTIYSVIDVPDSFLVANLSVRINVTHTWDSDLRITLLGPQGQSVVLADSNGGSGDNFRNTFFDDQAALPIDSGQAPFTGTYRPTLRGGGSLSVFNQTQAYGRWTLIIEDRRGGDSGTLESWDIRDSIGTSARPIATPQPLDFALGGAYPNPFNAVTRIPFALPRAMPVALRVYNVLGQEVRTLLRGTLDAGAHEVTWDGHDARGASVPSGLYLIRLEAAGRTATGKLVLLR